MDVLSSLFVIFVIVLLGILSRRFGIFQAEHAKTLSSYVYYFGLPALFFNKISHLDLFSLDPQMVLGTILPTLLILAILLILYLLKALKKDAFILLGLSISLGSYAFFGVAFFETFQDGQWLDMAILAASLLGVVGIVSTLTLLEYANRKKQSGGFLGKIFTNPLILSILLGALSSLTGIRLEFLSNAFNLVGQTASATAIFVLGMFIYDRFSLAALKQALPYALFRVIVLPLVTWAVIRIFIPGGTDISQFLLLESGMPAAIALVVFAERYNYRITETAGVVSLTSILSFLGLTAIYYLT
jgi:predicted permease